MFHYQEIEHCNAVVMALHQVRLQHLDVPSNRTEPYKASAVTIPEDTTLLVKLLEVTEKELFETKMQLKAKVCFASTCLKLCPLISMRLHTRLFVESGQGICYM